MPPPLPSCPRWVVALWGAGAHLDSSLLGAGYRAEVGNHGLRGRQVRVPFRTAPLLGRASQDKLHDLYISIYLDRSHSPLSPSTATRGFSLPTSSTFHVAKRQLACCVTQVMGADKVLGVHATRRWP